MKDNKAQSRAPEVDSQSKSALLPENPPKKNSEIQTSAKPSLILPEVYLAGAFSPDLGEVGTCLDHYTKERERGRNGSESIDPSSSTIKESSERLSMLLREDSSYTGVLKALESNRKDLENRLETSISAPDRRSLQEGLERLERGIASFEKSGSGIFLSDLLNSLSPKGDEESILEKGRLIAELKESYEKKHSEEVFSPEKSLFRDKADLLEIFQSIRRIGVLQGEEGLSDNQKSLILGSLLSGKEEVVYILEAKLTLDRLTEVLTELKELKTSHDTNRIKLSIYEKDLLDNHGDSKEVPYKDKNGNDSTKFEKISPERVKGLREKIESLAKECRLGEESMMALEKRAKVYQTNLVLSEGEIHALKSPDAADTKLLESLQMMERDSWSRSPRLVELWGRAMSRLEDSSVSEVMKQHLRGNERKARELATTSYEEKRKWGEYLRQEERGGIQLQEGSYDLVHKTQKESLGSGLKSLQEIKEEGLSFQIGEESKKVINRLEEQSKGIQYLELEGDKSRFVKISEEAKAKLSEVPEGYTAVLKRLPKGIRFEKLAVGKMVEEIDLGDMTGSGLKEVYRESGFVGVPAKITEAETLSGEDIVYVRKEVSGERLLVLDLDQKVSKGFKEIRLEEQKAKEDFLQVLRNDPGVQKALGTGSYVFERYVHLMSSLEKGMSQGQKREDWVEAVRSDAKELGQLLRRSDLSMHLGKMEKVSSLLSGLSESITAEGGLELEYLGGLCSNLSNLLKKGEIQEVLGYIEGADFDPDSVGKWMRTNGVLIGSTLLGATALASIPATMGTSSLGAVAILSGIGGYIGGEIGNAALSLDYKSFKSKMQRYAADEISFGEYLKESGLEIGYGAAFTYGIGHLGRFVGGAARNQLAQSASFGIRELPAYAVVQGAKVFEKFEHLSSKLIPGGQQNYLRIWMSEFIEESFEEGLQGGFGGAGGVLIRDEDLMRKAIGSGFLGVSQSIAILTSARRPNGNYPGGTTFKGFGDVNKLVTEGVFESQFEYESGKSAELKEFLNRSGKRVQEGENGELRVEGVLRGEDGEVVSRQVELYIPTQVPGYVRTLMKESVRADGSSVFTECGFRVNQQGEMLIDNSHTKDGVSLAKYLRRQGIKVEEEVGGRITIERGGGVKAEIRVNSERGLKEARRNLQSIAVNGVSEESLNKISSLSESEILLEAERLLEISAELMSGKTPLDSSMLGLFTLMRTLNKYSQGAAASEVTRDSLEAINEKVWSNFFRVIDDFDNPFWLESVDNVKDLIINNEIASAHLINSLLTYAESKSEGDSSKELVNFLTDVRYLLFSSTYSPSNSINVPQLLEICSRANRIPEVQMTFGSVLNSDLVYGLSWTNEDSVKSCTEMIATKSVQEQLDIIHQLQTVAAEAISQGSSATKCLERVRVILKETESNTGSPFMKYLIEDVSKRISSELMTPSLGFVKLSGDLSDSRISEIMSESNKEESALLSSQVKPKKTQQSTTPVLRIASDAIAFYDHSGLPRSIAKVDLSSLPQASAYNLPTLRDLVDRAKELSELADTDSSIAMREFQRLFPFFHDIALQDGETEDYSDARSVLQREIGSLSLAEWGEFIDSQEAINNYKLERAKINGLKQQVYENTLELASNNFLSKMDSIVNDAMMNGRIDEDILREYIEARREDNTNHQLGIGENIARRIEFRENPDPDSLEFSPFQTPKVVFTSAGRALEELKKSHKDALNALNSVDVELERKLDELQMLAVEANLKIDEFTPRILQVSNQMQNYMQSILQREDGLALLVDNQKIENLTDDPMIYPFKGEDSAEITLLLRQILSPSLREHIESDLQISFNDLSLRELVHFVREISGRDNTAFNELREVLISFKGDKIGLLSSFFGVAENLDIANTILKIARDLDSNSADAVFSKYNKILDQIELVKNELNGIEGKSVEADDIRAASQNILSRANKILLDIAKSSESDNEIVEGTSSLLKMSMIEEECVLFSSLARNIPLEQIPGVAFEQYGSKGKDLPQGWEQEMFEIAMNNARDEYGSQHLADIAAGYQRYMSDDSTRYYILSYKNHPVSFVRFTDMSDGAVFCGGLNSRYETINDGFGLEVLKRGLEEEGSKPVLAGTINKISRIKAYQRLFGLIPTGRVVPLVNGLTKSEGGIEFVELRREADSQ